MTIEINNKIEKERKPYLSKKKKKKLQSSNINEIKM